MEEIENIKNELNEIKTARDNIKTALENEGETVTNDIRTYADTIPNVNKVKTVNSVEADENKNVQLDASKINVDDTAETKQTIKDTIEDILASLGSNAKVLFWDGNEVSSTDTEGLKVWTDLIHYIYAGDDNYAIIVGKIPDTMSGSSDSYRPLFVFGWEQVSGTITLKSINRRRAYVNSMEGVTTPYSYVYTLKLIYSGNQVRTVYKITETVSEYKSYLPAGDLSNEQDITPYIPEKDYQPATKKYVDDVVTESINNLQPPSKKLKCKNISTYTDVIVSDSECTINNIQRNKAVEIEFLESYNPRRNSYRIFCIKQFEQ